jgi:SAM-dependent methyltransferase
MATGQKEAPTPSSSSAALGSLPQKLHGVSDASRSWWSRTDPAELLRVSDITGRLKAIERVSALVADRGRVLDLGCGPGLLAKAAGRRDIVGVDMSPQMIAAAQEWMDLVLPENLLEFYPSEPMDAVVMCNVLEPYPAEVRQLVLSHSLDFLAPGGLAVVVVAAGASGLGSGSESGLDLLFPTVAGGGAKPEDVEDDIQLAGFDLVSAELVDTRPPGTRPGTATSEATSEAAKLPDRKSFAVLVGRRPG